MRRYLPLMMVLGLLLTVGCGGSGPAATGRAGTKVRPEPTTYILPKDEPEGWERAWPEHPVKVYLRENVYLYLADKADLYNKYGLRKLEHGIYRPNLLGQPTAVIDACEMDHPINAYGIFSVQCKRDDKMIPLGGAAHVGEKECTFWKGNHFVRVQLMADVEKPEEVLTTLATLTEKNIRGSTSIPELGWFPADNRVPGGDSYTVENLLGYDFLPRGFTVEYDLAGQKATMVLCISPPELPPKKAPEGTVPQVSGGATAYVKLRRQLLGANETPTVLPGPWDHGYRATEPKLATTGCGLVALRGRYIVGIFGAPNEDAAVQMLSELTRKLR